MWVLLAWMVYDLSFSNHGYRVYFSEKTELETLTNELEELKAEREKLAKEILRLRNNPKALEELVHRELGYVHPDEFMLIMPDDKKNGAKIEGRKR
ncbi:MAG: septum formation initiator family protein [Mariprofundaceae bacterium]